MGSLVNCIKKHKIPASLAEEINDLKKAFLREGYRGEEAETSATEELLKETNTMIASVHSQVLEQKKAFLKKNRIVGKTDNM